MENGLQRFFRVLALVLAIPALLLSVLHGVRVRSPRQVVLRTAKSAAQALAPVLTLSGLLGGVLGWLTHSPLAMLSGLTGGLLSAGYILRVHDAARRLQREEHGRSIHMARSVPPVPMAPPVLMAPPVPTAPTARFALPALVGRRLVPSARWLRDISYAVPPGTQQPLSCDLWLPPATAAHTGTIIVYLHGGGFFTSSKDFGTRAFFRHLASQGHAVMDADYRLAPGATLMEMQADVRRAVTWIKAQASDYGIVPERIVLAGGSAGALLALLVAYSPNHPLLTPSDLAHSDSHVQGAVSYYGVVDLEGLYNSLLRALPAARLPAQSIARAADQARRLRAALADPRLLRAVVTLGAWLKGVEASSMSQYLLDNTALMELGLEAAFRGLMGGTPAEMDGQYRLLSPAAQAGPHSPPTLLMHGEHDHLLPPAATRKLAAKLRAEGARVVYLELPQTEHTFDLFLPGISPPAQAAQLVLDHFLASLADPK
jgi:acetyl esterase/lipase